MPTVKELKTLLHAKGMPVSGNKPELLARLKKKTVVATTTVPKKSVTGRMNVPKSKQLYTSSKSTKSSTNNRATVPRFQRGTGRQLNTNDYDIGNLITETRYTGTSEFGYGFKTSSNGAQLKVPTLDGKPVNNSGVYKSDKGNIAFLSYDSESRSRRLQWYSAVLKTSARYRGGAVGEKCIYNFSSDSCAEGNYCVDGKCVSERETNWRTLPSQQWYSPPVNYTGLRN